MAEEKKACCCSGRRKVRERTEEEALLQRLSRIEGQVRGVRGMVEKECYCTDILTQVSVCIFTNNGNMHLVKVLDLPYGKFRDKGTPIDNVSNYDSSKEDIVFIAPLMDVEKHKLIFGTKSAMIKLVDGAEFVVTRKTSQATKLMDDDELLFVDMLSENATMHLHGVTHHVHR